MSRSDICTNRIGEERLMNCGEVATIIEYNNCENMKIEFKKYQEIIQTTYINFKNNNIKSKMKPTIYNIGYLGVGDYNSKNNNKIYNVWHGMIRRCYDKKSYIKRPTYENITVCDEWHNFQNFAKWYDENYYTVDDETMHLDKDILYKDNKIYSPENCIFVPERINVLFTKRQNYRGEYPIGLNYNKQLHKIESFCSLYDNTKKKYRQKRIGLYSSVEEGFNSYKKFKENYIKQVANIYKDKIPKNLYDALYRYEVEITD